MKKNKVIKITIYNFVAKPLPASIFTNKTNFGVPRDFDIQGQKGNQLMLV